MEANENVRISMKEILDILFKRKGQIILFFTAIFCIGTTATLLMEPKFEATAQIVTGAEGAEFWPISLENDIERLDRLPVGYLVVPTAVDLSAVQSREATFGDKIKLLGYSASDLQPGDALELTLFWEVSDPWEGEIAPLHVFTHVLDSGGQLVAGHDGIPANGRYPTPSWLPGMTIADAHVIQLPPDLPAGDYEIRVGLYEPESGERLPVLAADGSVPPDNSFLLAEISIP